MNCSTLKSYRNTDTGSIIRGNWMVVTWLIILLDICNPISTANLRDNVERPWYASSLAASNLAGGLVGKSKRTTHRLSSIGLGFGRFKFLIRIRINNWDLVSCKTQIQLEKSHTRNSVSASETECRHNCEFLAPKFPHFNAAHHLPESRRILLFVKIYESEME